MPGIEIGIANRLAQGADGSLSFNGEELKIPQPGKPDWIALQKYLRKLHKAERDDTIAKITEETKGLPPNIQAMAIKAAVDSRVDPSNETLSAFVMEPKGLAFFLWTLASKKKPELKLAEVQAFVTEENVNDLAAQLLTETSMGDVDPNSNGATGSSSSSA